MENKLAVAVTILIYASTASCPLGGRSPGAGGQGTTDFDWPAAESGPEAGEIDQDSDSYFDDEDGGVDVSVDALWEEIRQGKLVPLDPLPLSSFFSALTQLEESGDQHVRILHWGDSHIAADFITAAIRHTLKDRFGDGGRGFVFLGKPWRSYQPQDVVIDAGGEWIAERIMLSKDPATLDGRYGLGGVSVEARDRGAWATVGTSPGTQYSAEASLVDIFFLRQPGGGSFAVEVDGERRAAAGSSGRLGSGFVSVNFDQGKHEVAVRTNGDGPVRLFGAALESETAGIVYDTLGVNGAFFSTPLRWDATLLEEQVARRDPQLIIANYGANEADSRSLTRTDYARTIRKTMARLTAGSPEASCLIMAPPDRVVDGDLSGNETTFDWLIAVQEEVAAEIGCSFLNSRDLMGGKGGHRKWQELGWAQPDGIHLTVTGYRVLGELIARRLIASYEEHIAESSNP
jgi:lysophospholipase L1-like esterase